MEKILLRISFLVIVLFYFAGCLGPEKINTFPVPGSGSVSVPNTKTAAAVFKNTRRLFIIERNKNENIVRYDASLTPAGELDPAAPVVAYWVLLNEDGRKKNLNWIEKKKKPNKSHQCTRQIFSSINRKCMISA